MAFSIPESTIEEIKSRIDLADLISSYGVQVRRAGSSYKACCPFHHERTPSFNIQPDRGFYHCFGCGESGDAIKFVMRQEGLGFLEAVRKLAERCGVTIEEKEDPQAGMRQRLLAIHAELAAFYHRCLLEAKEAQAARDYLKGRALDGEVAERFLIGYAPRSAAAMLKWAAKYGFRPEELTAAGVLLPPKSASGGWYNRFAGRVVFPVRDKMKRVVAFSCRTLETDKAKMRGGKYVNSPETPIFRKSEVLYALDQAAANIVRAVRREAIVCEGQIDVIRCHACGFTTAVASQGTSFTKEHVRLLKRNADSVVLVFDADAAGRKAAIRTGGEFLAAEMPVRVATLPPGEDPDSLLRTKGPDAFRECLDAAESITAFQIRTLRAQETSPNAIDAVSRVSRAVLEMIAQCPSAVMRASLTAEAAELLGLPPTALQEDMEGILKAARNGHPVAAPSSPANVDDEAVPPDAEDAVDAAAPVNNPPPLRELALCGFLFKHEKDAALAETVAAHVPPGLFAHDFTQAFVQAWLAGATAADDGTDEFAAFCRGLSPEELRWFDRISSDERDSLCERPPLEQLQDLLKLLWADAVTRRLGMLDATSTEENDRRRLAYTMTARRFLRGSWERVQPFMVPETLA